MKKIILSILTLSALAITSCSSDDNTPVSEVVAPATYSFDRNGETTVSYSGQTTRILMGEELISALKDNSKTESELLSMFDHQAGNNDFTDESLNSSSKNIRSKTAASSAYFSDNTAEAAAIKKRFNDIITAQTSEVFPKWDDIAMAGAAGKLTESGGSVRYINAKGLEYNQAFNKGLIGALMVDQILNNYLDASVLDAGTNIADNDADIVAEGKNYTTMEHKWDEAFGYLYGVDNALSPALNVDSFLNKYLSRVESDIDFAGIAEEIYNAFKLGRAAIVAKNYTVRDQQAAIIKAAISRVIGVRAVYYLQTGKNNLSIDKAAAFHDLSEGYGFVQSLRFTQNTQGEPYIAANEVNTMLTTLQENDGFWSISEAQLDAMSTTIANAFGFTVAEAAN